MTPRETDRPDRQFVKGGLTTVMLAALAESPQHGYELIQTIRERSDGIFDFADGTVYPLLYALRDRGWVRTVETTSPEGRSRKVYHLTAAGRAALKRQRHAWDRFSRGMALSLRPLGRG